MTVIKPAKLLTLLLAGLVFITPAKAENIGSWTSGWYVSGAFNIMSHNKIDTKATVLDVSVTAKEKFGTETRFSIAIGNHLSDAMRGELEISRGSVDGVVERTVKIPGQAPILGSTIKATTNTAIILNGYYDFNFGFMADSQIRPYVLGGIGYNIVADKSGGELTYQVGVGMGYALTPRANLFADYRYRSIFHGSLYDSQSDNLSSHGINAGLRYRF